MTVNSDDKNYYSPDIKSSKKFIEKQDYLYACNLKRDVIINDVKTIKKNNKYITTLFIQNINTNYSDTFKLEYPVFYDENNKVIQFINEYGYGSVEGLKNEIIKIDIKNKYSEDKIIATKNNLSIIDINKSEESYHQNIVIFIHKMIFLFNIIIFSFIGIIYISGLTTLATMLFTIYIWISMISIIPILFLKLIYNRSE